MHEQSGIQHTWIRVPYSDCLRRGPARTPELMLEQRRPFEEAFAAGVVEAIEAGDWFEGSIRVVSKRKTL